MSDDATPTDKPAAPTLAYRVRKPQRPTLTWIELVAPAAFASLLAAAIVSAWVAGVFFALLSIDRVGAIVMATAGLMTFVGLFSVTMLGHSRRERDYATWARRNGVVVSRDALEAPDAKPTGESAARGMAHLARAAGRATAKIHRRLQGDAVRRPGDR